MGEARLVLVRGAAAPAGCALPREGTVLLGRDASCDLVLEDERVSGRHARIEAHEGGWRVRDLDSANGTWVNGEDVAEKTLAPGDEVELGDVVLRLEVAGVRAPPRPVVEAAAPAGATLAGGPGPDRKLLEALGAVLRGAADEQAGLFESMLDGLLAAFGADRGVIFLPGEGRNEFVPSSRRVASPDVDAELEVSRSLVRRVASERRPLLLTSAETEEFRQKVETVAASLRSIVAAPLALPARGGVGVVYLDSVLERHRFRAGDEAILLAFTQAAGEILRKEERSRKLARRQEREAERRRREAAGHELIGESPAMRMVLKDVGKAGASDVAVLVTGESGTGKELVARALHRASPRADQPFVAVNCAAIPADLVESELFGHEKGAFSGADERRLGQFELADGGTLFLDEIGELPLPAQGKLLRALQERTVHRVGGRAPVPVDFRLVCATNVDLGQAVKEGRFREDLFYRIAVFRILLPPLRERGEDVLRIAEFFLARFSRAQKRDLAGFDAKARAALTEHDWPGNVRELRNVVEQAVVREDGAEVTHWSILPALGLMPTAPASPESSGGGGGGEEDLSGGFEEARKRFERRYLMHQIAAHKGNMKATSEAIGLSRKALYLKCDEYGIDYSAFR